MNEDDLELQQFEDEKQQKMCMGMRRKRAAKMVKKNKEEDLKGADGHSDSSVEDQLLEIYENSVTGLKRDLTSKIKRLKKKRSSRGQD